MASFAPDIITQIGPLPITNTLLHTLIVDGVLIALALTIYKNLKTIPHSLQAIIEPVIEAMYSLTESIATSKIATQRIFPYVMTFFLFILTANFTGLLPGVGTIGFHKDGATHSQAISKAHATEPAHEENTVNHEATPVGKEKAVEHTSDAAHTEASFIPLLRGATSDINLTLALAIISVVVTHMLSIQVTGINDYLARYFSFNPINLYVGLLELVAEVTKIISLSFRLFGNIFAGEIALHTISNLVAFVAPLPFLLLESIVSIVQALVFSVLTLVFMAVLTTPHHNEAHEGVSHA
ncbi:MAG TPA: FoF1 ATP synthase subunit a [Xanthomonadales bacterium]|nr:FoF1 ATP synthase subunit a [Xanthomonadales bacterium]